MPFNRAVASFLLLFIVGFLSPTTAQSASPHITSISQIWARQYQTIQISGSGFGSTRPYTGDSAFILVTDLTQNWSAGHTGDAVTLGVSSWTDSLISISGFNGAYGTGNQVLLVGDVLSFQVWNPQTGAGPGKGRSTAALANATELYNFLRGSDAANPEGGVIMDSDGNLYGSTSYGGIDNRGTVYELTKGANSVWTETLLHQFTGSDGDYPLGELARDAAGNLYGVTFDEGTVGCGTVFEIVGTTGIVLHSFQGGSDGCSPEAGLTMDSLGNLYGTTAGFFSGGTSNGTVFELSPNGAGGFNYSVIYQFKGGDFDGAQPSSSLTLDASGNLYGTTYAGGGTLPRCDSRFPQSSCGTVFELSPVAGGGWSEKLLHTFHGTGEGYNPFSGLTFDDAGNLFGAAAFGGPSNINCPYTGCGVVFALAPRSDGTWEEKTLVYFQGGVQPSRPIGDLAYYNGIFYGYTDNGSTGVATIYTLTPLGKGQWSFAIVYPFGFVTDGGYPIGKPFFGPDGTLYGASTDGGATFGGVIFSLP
jgi:uncharacterized repeat protein (TIGR03803 family)